MGWSLRKSFKFGPTRINLSSRGIGYSVGVRGVRIGTSGGRSYIRGGRGMLRYQAALGSAPSGGGSAARAGLSPTTAVATGGGSLDPVSSCGLALIGLLGGFVLLVVLLAASNVTRVLTLIAVAAVVLVGMVNLWSRAAQRAKYQSAVAALDAAVNSMLTAAAPTEQHARRVATDRQQLAALPEGRAETFEAAYRSAVADAVADQNVTPQERARLGLLARGLGLAPDVVQRANLGGFLEGFYALVGDGKLTEEEDAKLTALRTAFNIPESQLSAQLAKADQLRRARHVEQTETLLPIAADVKLAKGENAFHSADAAEMRYYVERDYQPVKSGRIYVTNERLLFVGEGTTSIKLEKIMRLSMEPRREGGEIVALSIDGRKTPYYIFTAEAFVLVAHIKRAWEATHNAA